MRNDGFFDDSVGNCLAEFDSQHGESFVYDGWVLFADGATREVNPLGLLVEPPSDPYEKAKRIALYWKLVFEKAVRDFDAGRQYLADLAAENLNSQICGPAPEKGAMEELKGRHKAALNAKKKYEKALAQVEALKPREVSDREICDQHNRQSNSEIMSQLNAMSI